MTDQSKAKRENRKPWEHTIQVGINWLENLDGTRDAAGMLASCTCGRFSFPFAEGMDPAVVLDHTTPHVESHPMPPISTAALGDDSVVLVMAVPGPDNSPVHMSISVSKEVYDDGEKLAHHLGTIGSPLHFQILEQRASFHERVKGMGFHSVPLPPGVNGIQKVLDTLRGYGHVIDRIDYMEPDGTVRPIEIPGLTGLRNEPDIKLGDIGPRGDEPRPDFDDPDEYAP